MNEYRGWQSTWANGGAGLSDPTIDTVFDLLDEWRGLPSYQLERRADIYFALFLAAVLESHCNTEFEPLVIPEFPLRRGTLWAETERKYQNYSVKVDYVAFTKGYEQVVFVELKTDMESLRSKQDEYLHRASKLEFGEFLNGLCPLITNSRQRKKYDRLIHLLSNGPRTAVHAKPKIVYIQPKGDAKGGCVITFEEFAKVVERSGDIGRRFAQSLTRWAS